MAKDLLSHLKFIVYPLEDAFAIKYVGSAAYIKLDNGIVIKVYYTITSNSSNYDALCLKAINSKNAEIDTNLTPLKNIIGRLKTKNPNFPEGVLPHLWLDRGEVDWYAAKPSSNDFDKLTDHIWTYVEVWNN